MGGVGGNPFEGEDDIREGEDSREDDIESRGEPVVCLEGGGVLRGDLLVINTSVRISLFWKDLIQFYIVEM